MMSSYASPCFFHLPCRFVFAMLEDLEMSHCGHTIFTMVRRSSCISTASWIILSISSKTKLKGAQTRKMELRTKLSAYFTFYPTKTALKLKGADKDSPCGGRKTSPRTSTIVQFIFYFWSFEISVNILRNQK